YERDHLFQACEDILAVVNQPDFAERSVAAIPPGEDVPGQTKQPLFLQFDFALVKETSGEVVPQLIECQGFPSLYFFQYLLDQAYRKHFAIPDGLNCRFGDYAPKAYLELLRDAVLGGYAPEHVILLEVDPKSQTTRIDFTVCCRELGIAEVCISEVELDNGKLFYELNGKRTRIHRIFNRVIFDELNLRPELKRSFTMVEAAEVEWAGHPNWFFLLSKFTLPMISSRYVPDTRFLDQVGTLPDDLDNYVLKPLYSFAGAGVDLHPTAEKIAAIERPEHFILQQKVEYARLIETLDEAARAEVRMMFLWPDGAPEPILLNNLVRLTKGEMVGVKYNKDKTWVGGSLGYFE
ncbi:MAG: hypothetical protein AAF597_11170, partial [Bacteroidota bacterium]